MKNLIAVIGFSILLSCTSAVNKKTEISNFKIEVQKSESRNYETVRISGESMDSALWIKEYRIEYRNENVYLFMTRSLRKTGMSGPYRIEFIISPDTRNIFLGKDELIWSR